MNYRAKQFFSSLFPIISERDLIWVNKTLTTTEITLFKKLPLHEQQHSIAVAKDCSRLNGSAELVKAALLHDIGKIEGNLNIINKSLVVLLSPLNTYIHHHKRFMPHFIRKAFHYKEHHPSIGATLLKKNYLKEIQDLSADLTSSQKRILELIEAHHYNDHSCDSELQLLKRFDESH